MTCCTLLGIGLFSEFWIRLGADIRNLRIVRSLIVGDVSGDPVYNGFQGHDNFMTNMFMFIIIINSNSISIRCDLQLARSGRVRKVYVTTIMK